MTTTNNETDTIKSLLPAPVTATPVQAQNPPITVPKDLNIPEPNSKEQVIPELPNNEIKVPVTATQDKMAIAMLWYAVGVYAYAEAFNKAIQDIQTYPNANGLYSLYVEPSSKKIAGSHLAKENEQAKNTIDMVEDAVDASFDDDDKQDPNKIAETKVALGFESEAMK